VDGQRVCTMVPMRTYFMSAALLVTSCGGEDPPSCQQAIGHYYSAGCTYVDQGQVVTACQQTAAGASDSCQDDLDVWLVCNNSVPEGASMNSQCDCSEEFMALLRCE
jgi:hypothetical protein